MLMWIAEAPDMQAPDSATACIMIAASVMPSPAPPIFLRHGDAQPVALGHGGEEGVGEGRGAVALQPVGIVEAARRCRSTSSRICCCGSVRAKSMGRPFRQLAGWAIFVPRTPVPV